MESALKFLIAMAGESPLEILAVAFGLANVVLIVRRSVWNYPFGMVMVTLYAWIFFHANLYGNASLQFFFFSMQAYGWWYWLKSIDSGGHVIVQRLTTKQALRFAVAAGVGIAAAGYVINLSADAAQPYWDASIAVLSVIAQFLLARRRLENWIVWIMVDVLAIGLYWRQGLHPTAVLYAVFLCLSTIGYFSWRRAYRRNEAVQ